MTQIKVAQVLREFDITRLFRVKSSIGTLTELVKRTRGEISIIPHPVPNTFSALEPLKGAELIYTAEATSEYKPLLSQRIRYKEQIYDQKDIEFLGLDEETLYLSLERFATQRASSIKERFGRESKILMPIRYLQPAIIHVPTPGRIVEDSYR